MAVAAGELGEDLLMVAWTLKEQQVMELEERRLAWPATLGLGASIPILGVSQMLFFFFFRFSYSSEVPMTSPHSGAAGGREEGQASGQESYF